MLGSEYVIKYISDLTEATAGAKEVERVNADMAKTISSDFQQATRVLGTSLDKISETPIKLKGGEEAIKTVSQLGTVIQTSDGSFKEFTKTQTFVDGQLTKTAGSLKDVTGQFGKTAVESAKAQKNVLTLGENLGRLAKRALLTIPIWLALRGAIMGTFSVIRDGLKTIEDQDRTFQKAKRVMHGTAFEIERNFGKLKEAVTKLSIESGESVEKITEAFQRFSTVGFDFETSMKGAEFAIKTAVVLFGDAEESANAFARAMRVLVDRSEGAKSAGDQIAEAMALTTALYEDNAFTLSEFTQSLEKFAGTAKATNFTTQQTIALLASLSTGGLRGSRAGTLLRSSVVKLLTNLDKLSGTLGVKVNPQLDSTFDVLMKVLDAVQGLDKGSQVAEQTANAIGKIFGGVRGMEAVLALKALREEMLKNIQTVGGVDKLNESYDDVNKTLSRLITQFHNLNREIGKAFVTSVIGADDFAGAIEDVNTKKLPVLSSYLNEIGDLLNKLGKYNIASPYGSVLDSLIKIRKEQQKLFEDITLGLRGALSRTDLIDVLARIRIMTEDKLIEISPQTILALEQKLIEATQKLEISPEITVNQTITRRVLTIEEEQDIAKAVLAIELDKLRTLNATNSQLLKAEDLYSHQLNIEENSLDKVKRKLEYEKAINEEKRLQNKLGSDSIKLFDIAQTEGLNIAKAIGDVLAGQIDFNLFVRRGGKELEIFKREFADIFKQQQALAFFKGQTVPELPNLRGGLGINIQEDAIRRLITQFTPEVFLQQSKTVREFQRLETLKVQVEAPININAEIDISKLSEVNQVFIDSVAKQLPQAGSKLNIALKNALVGKQSVTL